MIELLVSLAIVGAVMAGAYSGFTAFSSATRAAMNETNVIENVSVAANILRQDLELAGWGLPASTRAVGDNGGGEAVAESALGVDIDGDGAITGTITTDRLFVADGLKIVTDSGGSGNGGYFPDEEIASSVYVKVADAKAQGGHKATLTGQGSSSADVSTPNVNSDSETTAGWYTGITYNCVDIRDGGAVIVGGKTSGGGYGVEGHRISGVSPAGTKTCGSASAAATVTFVSGDTMGATYVHDNLSIAVPAAVWYVDKKSNDDTFWLYRNENKVLADVVDFQVSFGLDYDHDGLEWSATAQPTTSGALKKRPEHTLDHLPSTDPTYATRNDATGGEIKDHFAKPREVLESLRTVWVRITTLRTVASEKDADANTVATAYTDMVILRN